MKGSVMSDRIKPHFRKKMPENAIEFSVATQMTNLKPSILAHTGY